jgi:hypothetical protein
MFRMDEWRGRVRLMCDYNERTFAHETITRLLQEWARWMLDAVSPEEVGAVPSGI